MFDRLLKTLGFRGRDKLKQQIANADYSPDYKPQTLQVLEEIVQDLPIFTLRTAMLMMADPIVQIALQMRDAALMPGEINVECRVPAAKQLMESTWKKLWTLEAPKVIKTKLFGFSAFQPRYKINDLTGYLEFEGLRAYAPQDTKALRDSGTGDVAGFNLRSTMGGAGVQAMMRPKALWCTFDALWGTSYGRAIQKRAYGPWYEKWMRHGAKKVQQLRMLKDSYVGDILYYPMDRYVTLPNGDKVPWRDLLREIGENRLAGGIMALPMLMDKDGKKLIEYQPPQDCGNPSGIFEWVKGIDDDICKGLGVPPEVIQASETGSGFSGRSIPMAAFLQGCMVEFGDYVQAINYYVLKPLLWLNFGESVECLVTPKPLIETFTADIGGSGVGGGAMGQPQQQQPAQPPLRIESKPQEKPEQFAEPIEDAEWEPSQFAEQLRSPKGSGVTIDGTFFPPGEWIPKDVAAKLTGKQWSTISGKPPPEQHATEPSGRPAKGGAHPGAEHGSSVTIKPTKQRAFNGEPVKTKTTLTKQETGRVGEAVVLSYLKSVKGHKDARPMNAGMTNFPIDLIEDHAPTEVKAGLASNSSDAQKWRLTFSKESAKEKELYEKMSPAERTKWYDAKQKRILERKQKALKEIEKATGKKAKPRTICAIINPDTRTADLYSFDNWHDILRWNSEESKAAYVGSYQYAE